MSLPFALRPFRFSLFLFLRMVSYSLCVIPRRTSSSESCLVAPTSCLFSAPSSLHLVFHGLPGLSAVLAFAFYLALPTPICSVVCPPAVCPRVSCTYRLCMFVYILSSPRIVVLSSTSNLCASPFKFYIWINHLAVLGRGEYVLTKEAKGKKIVLWFFIQ